MSDLVEQGIDPVTFEVIRHRLWAINDEQAMIATRISPSPVVYEAYDFNSGLLTADGRGLFVGVYIIHHAVPIDIFVNRILSLWPSEEIREGDMFFTNDPWSGALHHNDGILVSPVFFDGEIVLWTGIVMHDEDVGSPVPGSFVVGARDRFGEAPLIPPVKMVERFEVRRDVESIFIRNSRRPDANALNIRARAAALTITHQRIHQLCDQYGKATFLACQEEIVDYVERVVRRRLLEIPDGEWFEHAYIDHDGNDNELYELRCTVRKRRDRVTFDFTGTSQQAPGAINCARGGLEGASLGVFLIFLCHDLPWSVGAARRVVEIVSEEGTLNNASGTAGVSMASVMGTWVTQNVASNAFAKMLLSSEKYRSEAMACWQPGINGQVIAGIGRRDDTFATVLLDCSGGGAGARTFADGVDSGGFMQSMSATVPNAETTEHRYPVLQIYRRERQGSSGHGRFRGGLGLEYGLLPHKSRGPIVDLVFASGVSQPEGHGLSGGGPAAVASNIVLRGSNIRQVLAGGDVPESLEELEGERIDVLAAKDNTLLEADDFHILLLSGGGGYGDPLLRDPERVALDVRRAKVTEDAARSIYGVVLEDGRADLDRTGEARAALREHRLRESSRVDEAVGGGTIDGEHLHPVADTLEAVETSGGKAIRCTRCSYRLSAYAEDYKRGTVMRELPITALSPLNARGLVEEVVAREFYCPGCGTSLALDVQRISEAILPEARFGP